MRNGSFIAVASIAAIVLCKISSPYRRVNCFILISLAVIRFIGVVPSKNRNDIDHTHLTVKRQQLTFYPNLAIMDTSTESHTKMATGYQVPDSGGGRGEVWGFGLDSAHSPIALLTSPTHPTYNGKAYPQLYYCTVDLSMKTNQDQWSVALTPTVNSAVRCCTVDIFVVAHLM